ncbi:type II secretion system protein [Pseudobacteriovorax antillogorgiicola]|nr:prepilin-type N-terminal cleavage/methylation domain-containing protein [Pseudobacteriovorax antillogorgiicola]
MKQAGFSIIELMIAVGVVAMITIGIARMISNQSQAELRSDLKRNYRDMSQRITKRVNHYFRRQIAIDIVSSSQLRLQLPDGDVTIETICSPTSLDYHDSSSILDRCLECEVGNRHIVRIGYQDAVHYFPSKESRVDHPAATMMCFEPGADASEVAVTMETILVDPVKKSGHKRVSSETILVGDLNNVNFFR